MTTKNTRPTTDDPQTEGDEAPAGTETAPRRPQDEAESTEGADGEQADETEDGDEAETERDKGGNAEAARYRRRLREVEVERDGLRQEVDAMRRSVVDQVLDRERTRLRVTEAAFWAHTDNVAALLDDDGRVDLDRVRTAANEARDRFGETPTNPRSPLLDLGAGKRGGTSQVGSSSESVFEHVR